jgi:triacylglycerol lipase
MLVWLLACMPPPSPCEDLREALGACTGVPDLPVPCDDLTPGDVDALIEAVDLLGCGALRGVLPMDGDPLAASCALLGEGCVADPIPDVADGRTRHPLVLVNGIDVSPLFSWSERIVATLRARGHDVHLAVVPPYDSTPSRSAVLWAHVQAVLAATGAEQVNLVCHSLGGLDCRYLVSPGGLHWEVPAGQDEIVGAVASITTVGTAHAGTPVADVALGFVAGEDPGDALDRLATAFGSWLTEDALEQDVDLRAALGALTESQAQAFDAQVPDAEGVYYQSWAGYARPWGAPGDDPRSLLREACAADDGEDGLALAVADEDRLPVSLIDSWTLVAEQAAVDGEAEAPNDGLCPVRSARWGRFRGCVPADHMEQLGRGGIPDANVRTRVDIAAFYAAIAADLAEMGF